MSGFPMAGEVILYDIPSKDGHSWSLNPWKPRLVLNYKGIPYKTEWVEYPDLEPTFKSFGIEGIHDGRPHAYTSPAAKLDANTYIMDSMAITKELEKRHPSPSLHLDSPYQQRALEALGKVFEGTRGIWMPKVPNNLLNPKSAEYFQRTRSQAVGMPLAQYQAEKGGETAWKNSEEAIKSMAALLKENDGPFLMGDELSYGDFILASAIHFLGRIDKSDGERLVGMDPALGRLMDATKKYFEKSD